MESSHLVHRVPGWSVAVALAVLALGAMPSLAGTSGAPCDGAVPSNRELLERIDRLEKEIRELKKDTRVLEVTDETQAKAKPVAGYQDGFFINSPDGKTFKLKVGGYAQLDSRFALDEADNPTVDSFSLRRARIDLRGTVAEMFDFRLQPDFGGGTVVLQDAYVDAKFAPWAVLRAGKFKTPYGLERLQTDTNGLFVEASLFDNLVPNRDVGVELYGDLRQGEFGYQLALLNGVPDSGNGDADVNDAVDVALRLFAQPFKNTAVEPLHGFGVGVAGTYGMEQGTPASPQLPAFRTSSRNTYFRYAADNPATSAGTTVADGEHWRVSPQAYWYFGPFGSLFEYGVSSQELLRGTVRATTINSGWQLRASWLLTGEDATYGAVVPASNFSLGGGGWGAWELALRYANLDIDGDTFTKGFADNTRSVSEIDSITTGLNWYMNRNVRWVLNYEHSIFAKGVKIGDRDPENVFLTRLQFLF